jgi:hypothetical protein
VGGSRLQPDPSHRGSGGRRSSDAMDRRHADGTFGRGRADRALAGSTAIDWPVRLLADTSPGADTDEACMGCFRHCGTAGIGTCSPRQSDRRRSRTPIPEARAGAAAVALASWLAARSRGAQPPARAELCAQVAAPLDPNLQTARGLRVAAELGADAPLGDAVFQLGNGARVTCADTVPLALWIAFGHLGDYAAAIRHAVAAGGDADTIAAIVGGIVAARVGEESIPRAWRERVEPLA